MKLYQEYRKKKFEEGGGARPASESLFRRLTDPDSKLSSGISGIGALGAGIIDAAGTGDPLTGRRSTGAVVGKSTLTGASMGVQVAGPLGAGVGAVIGAGLGFITSGKQKQEARQQLASGARDQLMMENDMSNARIGANPELVSGHLGAGYYATGGQMGKMTEFAKNGSVTAPLAHAIMYGGKAKSLSSDNVEFKGSTHSQGGIDITGLDAEVEKGETAKGNYVFSKLLGFSDLHKPIAEAKGKIENKPMTQERINTLDRLNKRENNLILAQEYFKHARTQA